MAFPTALNRDILGWGVCCHQVHITPPPHVSHSLSNVAWDSLTCSMRSGLVNMSAAQFASEHTQRGSRVKSSFTCSQKSFVIRSWVCVFCERPFLKASCIGLLSTSTTAVLPLRQPGWVVVASLSTSCRCERLLVVDISVVLCCREVGSCFENGKHVERSPNQAAPCLGRGVCGP